MTDTLPLRFRILHYISTVDKTCVDDVMKALEPEYGRERQFKKQVIRDHLLDMKANQIIDDNDVTLDENGKLVIYYSIREEGKKLLDKYLPKRWREK